MISLENKKFLIIRHLEDFKEICDLEQHELVKIDARIEAVKNDIDVEKEFETWTNNLGLPKRLVVFYLERELKKIKQVKT